MKSATTLAATALLTIGLQGPALASTTGETPPLMISQAEALIDQGDFEKAVSLLAPRMTRLRTEKWQNRGFGLLCRAHLLSNDYEMGVDACTKAIETGAGDWLDFSNRGAAHYLAGDYQAALQDFNRARELNPDSANVVRNRQAALAALDSMASERSTGRR
ncbi:MAG: tetratricopeptide repeat protein [Pseudomonadota bacterium]